MKKNIQYALVLLGIIAIWAGLQLYDYYLFQKLDVECKESYKNAKPKIEMYKLFVDFVSQQELVEMSRPGQKRFVVHPPGSIYFYTLTPESNVTRGIQLTNPYCYPLTVNGKVEGIITPHTKLLNNDVYIRPFSEELMKIDIKHPVGVKIGNYYGNLTLTFTPRLA
jgi:hypothetical protein